MDLASVVAALASVGVRVSGSTPNNNIQGDSSRACPTGLAGPEPSGTLNDPGQHFYLPTSFPNIPKLILHEVQNKRQRFENLVNEAESAGEHLSDGELKAIIFAKMPADTAASLRQEQSNEKVKSWCTEVTGFPKAIRARVVFTSEMALKSALQLTFPSVRKKMVLEDSNLRRRRTEIFLMKW